MHYYEVAPTIIAHGEHAFLTYHSDQLLRAGALVMVEVGKKNCLGVVFRSVNKPRFPTKPINELIEDTPLPTYLLELAQWMSTYYASNLATVLQTILPRGVNKKRRKAQNTHSYPIRKRTNIVLNSDQDRAVSTINNATAGTILLRGVTGSGKTQVYIEAAKKAVLGKQSVIVLVPEIALTSQLVAEFSQHFTDTIVTHSTMTEAERHIAWQRCLTATTEPLVVIGPRSALFSPLPNLGLVIIDECHEPSYKQEQSPRYSALRVASMIARYANIKTVFGSATPTIVDTYLALQANRPIALMPESAQQNTAAPSVTVIDMTNKDNFSRHRFLSTKLLSTIEQSLKSGSQSLVFHNRRGSAPLTLCENCGWTSACPACFMPLTLHTDTHKLICHNCGYKSSVPPHCPVCREPGIVHKGIGTKLIADELHKQFPHASIARFDADTAKPDQLHQLYQQLYDGKIDIIVGTQIVAKGLDLPNLRTVGIIQADGGLNIPDYQSEERVFQLIYQVSGRVGRSHHKTDVVVQTYQPQHPSVQLGIDRNYNEFYEYTISQRQRAFFPPFCHLLKLTCSYATEKGAVNASAKLASLLKTELGNSIQILGPAPSFYERMGGNYRWQLIIKSTSRESLIQASRLTPKQHWFIDLDPANLL